MLYTRALITVLAALATTVHGHGAMVAVTGANGITGAGLGINPATPRDGTRRNPFEQDTSIINDKEIASGKASPCGRTLGGGVNDIASGVAAAASTGIPSMSASGQLSMTLHQVNGDGAGPYTCEVSTDATGATFVPMTVVTNVPGTNSRSRAKATDFPLVAQAAPGVNCTGGPDGNACLVRCRNGARAGPFGGCAVVTTVDVVAPSSQSTADSNATQTDTTTTSEPVATQAAVTQPLVTNSETGTATTSDPVAAQAAATQPLATSSPQADVGGDQTDQADQADQEDKRSLVESITNLFIKRDHPRKRMFNSRVVEMQKRGQWI